MKFQIKVMSAVALMLNMACHAGAANADDASPSLPAQQSSRQAMEIVLQSLLKKGALTQEQVDTVLADTLPTGAGNVYQAAKLVAQSLIKKQVWTKERADAMWAELGLTPADAVDNTVRVTYIPQIVQDSIRERLKQDVLAQARQERWGDPGAMPEWTTRLHWEGDIRVRGQQDKFQADNYPYFPNFMAINAVGNGAALATPFLNSTEDRDRMRLRARLGLLANVTDGVAAVMRLASGSGAVPISTNYTLGNMNNRPPVLFDQAYIKADPWSWLSFMGGRMPNPWFASDLVWADDLAFDGVALSTKSPAWHGVSGFATAGAFPLQEIELSQSDKWLYGAQVGTEWTINRVRSKLGVAYYDYRNISGIRNDTDSHLYDYTAPQYMQKGNTLFNISQDTKGKPELYALAADYKELDILALIDTRITGQTHMVLAADMVKNIGFSTENIFNRTGATVDKHVNGYLLKASLGMPKLVERNDWQLYLGYKRVGADAVLDAFVDPDFHLGGTNAKGWIIGGGLAIARNTFITARWLTADEIYGVPMSIDVGQIDLNVKF